MNIIPWNKDAALESIASGAARHGIQSDPTSGARNKPIASRIIRRAGLGVANNSVKGSIAGSAAAQALDGASKAAASIPSQTITGAAQTPPPAAAPAMAPPPAAAPAETQPATISAAAETPSGTQNAAGSAKGKARALGAIDSAITDPVIKSEWDALPRETKLLYSAIGADAVTEILGTKRTLGYGDLQLFNTLSPAHQKVWADSGKNAAMNALHGPVRSGSVTLQKVVPTISRELTTNTVSPEVAASQRSARIDRQETITAKAAEEKAAEDAKAAAEKAFYNALSPDDKASWDTATPEQRASWVADPTKKPFDILSEQGDESRTRTAISDQEKATAYLLAKLDPNSPEYQAQRDALMQDIYGAGAAGMAATRTQAGLAGLDPEQIQSMTIAQQRSNINKAAMELGDLSVEQNKDRASVAQYLKTAGLTQEQWLAGEEKRDLENQITEVGLNQALENLRQDKEVNPLLVTQLTTSIDLALEDLRNNREVNPENLKAIKIANETAQWKLDNGKALAPYELDSLRLSVEQAQWDLDHGKTLEPYQIQALNMANQTDELSYDAAKLAYTSQVKSTTGTEFQNAVTAYKLANPQKFTDGSWKTDPAFADAKSKWNAYATANGLPSFDDALANNPNLLENQVNVAGMNDVMVAMAQLDSQEWFSVLPESQQKAIKNNLSQAALTGGGSFALDENGDLVLTSATGVKTVVFNNKVTASTDPETGDVVYRDPDGDVVQITPAKYFTDIAKYSPAALELIGNTDASMPGFSAQLQNYAETHPSLMPSQIMAIASQVSGYLAKTPGTATAEDVLALNPAAKDIITSLGGALPVVSSIKNSSGVTMSNADIAAAYTSGVLTADNYAANPITFDTAMDVSGKESQETYRVKDHNALEPLKGKLVNIDFGSGEKPSYYVGIERLNRGDQSVSGAHYTEYLVFNVYDPVAGTWERTTIHPAKLPGANQVGRYRS